MTGKELILYILLNDFEDEEIDKDGKLVGFITIEEMALKRSVGVETVRTWIELGQIKSITIGGLTMIPEKYIYGGKELEE